MFFFDKFDNLTIETGGNLPHWHQNGKIQFVTFRLADSLPQSRIRELRVIIQKFKDTHPEPWNDHTLQAYHKLIGPIENRLLDNGYGSCVFRNTQCRKILSDAIKYFDGERYVLIAYVIMPNHVHILLLENSAYPLKHIIPSIKRYSTMQINSLYQRVGNLWMKNYFDRIIRTERHYHYCLEYIRDNPRHLSSDEYELYFRKTTIT